MEFNKILYVWEPKKEKKEEEEKKKICWQETGCFQMSEDFPHNLQVIGQVLGYYKFL